jgi:hypothetical protein
MSSRECCGTRPACEPACRRGRVEENQGEKPEPVAICRLKRVAADYKDDIRDRLPRPASKRNGKRVACVGAGPASLTVARDLVPLGYHVTVFDSDRLAGGMIRSQIPKFRLPESVIDEETASSSISGSTSGAGIASIRSRRSSPRATTPSSSAPAPAWATSTFRGAQTRREPVIHIGIDWLSSVSFGHVTKIGRRVIVLGERTPPWTAAAPRADWEART